MKRKKKIQNFFVHCGLAILAFFWILPIVWVILTSFRAGKGSYSGSFIPESFTITNFTRLFTENEVFNFPRWFGNTFFVAIFTCILSTFYLLSIAYVMSRLRFRARKPLLNISLILGMFPGFMSMIAIYYILKGVGLTDGSLKILATNWKIFTKIIMPLSKPIIIYTVITSFLAPWIDFILAKVIVGSDAKYYTVAIGLWNMLEKENIYQWYTRFAAGAVCVSIPIAILFIITQKYYAEGLAGSVKG